MRVEAIQCHRHQDFPCFPSLFSILHLLHLCSWKWEARWDVGSQHPHKYIPMLLGCHPYQRTEIVEPKRVFQSVIPKTFYYTWCTKDTRNDTATYLLQYVETYNTLRNRSVPLLHVPHFHFIFISALDIQYLSTTSLTHKIYEQWCFFKRDNVKDLVPKPTIFASKIKSSASVMHSWYVHKTFKQNLCLIFCRMISSPVNSTCNDFWVEYNLKILSSASSFCNLIQSLQSCLTWYQLTINVFPYLKGKNK